MTSRKIYRMRMRCAQYYRSLADLVVVSSLLGVWRSALTRNRTLISHIIMCEISNHHKISEGAMP